MSAIRAIYENGVFRPLRPVKLPEGAPVELIIVEEPQSQPASSETAGGNIASEMSPTPLVGEELAALLDQIASLPYIPHADGRTDISVHHDDILYPKNGNQP